MFKSNKSTRLEQELASQLRTARETIARQAAAIETHRQKVTNPWKRATINTTVHAVEWPAVSLSVPLIGEVSFSLPLIGGKKAAAPAIKRRQTQQAAKPVVAAVPVQQTTKPAVPSLPAPAPSVDPLEAAAMRLFNKRYGVLSRSERKSVSRAVANGQAH